MTRESGDLPERAARRASQGTGVGAGSSLDALLWATVSIIKPWSLVDQGCLFKESQCKSSAVLQL